MSTLTDAVTTGRKRPGPACSVAVALAVLRENDPDSAADLERFFEGEMPELTDEDIHSALQSLNFRVGRYTIGSHRRGQCRCFA